MVREVSDDKKNDSLEFNEFVKVRQTVTPLTELKINLVSTVFSPDGRSESEKGAKSKQEGAPGSIQAV